MSLRWRKDKRPTGLAGVCAGPSGHTLFRDGNIRCATVSCIRDWKSWYWVAGWESGIPKINTCNNPLDSVKEAKEQAMKYVKWHLKP